VTVAARSVRPSRPYYFVVLKRKQGNEPTLAEWEAVGLMVAFIFVFDYQHSKVHCSLLALGGGCIQKFSLVYVIRAYCHLLRSQWPYKIVSVRSEHSQGQHPKLRWRHRLHQRPYDSTDPELVDDVSVYGGETDHRKKQK
jgi:hypothetical protein